MTTVRYDCGHEIDYPVRVVGSHDFRHYWTAQSAPAVPGMVAACLGCSLPYRPYGEYRRAVEIRPS